MRLFPLLLLVTAVLHAQSPRDLVRHAVELDAKNTDLAPQYSYHERRADRDPKKPALQTWDVTMMEGSPYRRLIARNDQPLSAAEQQNEQNKMQWNLEQRRKETPVERAHRIAEWEKRRRRLHEPLSELPDAFDFTIAGETELPTGPAYIIDAVPHPGYRPKAQAASYFPKMKGRLLIDKRDGQWVKVEAESVDAIYFAGFLLRVAKGTTFHMGQTRVADGVWLPAGLAVKASARIAFVKPVQVDFDISYSDYRK